jgi:phosphate transport system ATP-binding protein
MAVTLPKPGHYSFEAAREAQTRQPRKPILIETHKVGVRYGERVAIHEVSLPIEKHAITALVGPSGCGKTSFLCSLNRLTDLVPKCKVTGSVRFKGGEILDPTVDVLELRRRVGLIFQRPNPFPLSIRENIAMPLRDHGLRDRHELEQITESVLREVGLWDEVRDRLNTSALGMSGGQQQRLCIARALALKPEVLLFDEPCSALDPIASGVVEDRIASLRDRFTIVIVTHNLAQARRIADTTALFWVCNGRGCLVEYGQTAQFFDAPESDLTAAYLRGLRG